VLLAGLGLWAGCSELDPGALDGAGEPDEESESIGARADGSAPPFLQTRDLGTGVTFLKRNVHVDVRNPLGRGVLWCQLDGNTRYDLHEHPQLLVDIVRGQHYLVHIRNFQRTGCQFSRGLVWIGHVAATSGTPVDGRTQPGPSFIVGNGATWLKRRPDIMVDYGVSRPDDYCQLDPNTIYRTYEPPVLEANHYRANILYFTLLGCGFSQGYIYREHIKLVQQEPDLGEEPVSGTPAARTRAILDVIGCAEGTGDSYDIMYSGRRIPSLRWHPNQVICAGGLCSSAAGRYQYLDTTWRNVASALRLGSFEPPSQDRGAIYLLKRVRSVHPENLVTYDEFSRAAYLLCWEWASFPGNCYGQSRSSIRGLWQVYQASLEGRNVGQACRQHVGGLSPGASWNH
jgi:muramidase (phage lysozyme)